MGDDEIKLVRKNLNWHYKPFEIPSKLLTVWKSFGNKGSILENKWNNYLAKKKIIIKNVFKNNFLNELKNEKLEAVKNQKSIASRKASELTLTALTKNENVLIGGSADLAGSNNTKTKFHKIIKPGNFEGNYIHYGVREHAMCAIMNGLSLHSKFIPYGNFFNFFRLLQTFD